MFKVVEIEAKMKFLSICMNRHILHPSNDKKGIDFDLLLLQQQRRICNQLEVMNTELNSLDKNILNTLNKSQKNVVLIGSTNASIDIKIR